MKNLFCFFGLLAITSCTSSLGDELHRVTEANTLGVTTLEVDRSAGGDTAVFELRGVDASGAVRARILHRTGVITGISASLPGDTEIGNEVTITVDDKENRILSRELHLFKLSALEPKLQAFVEIPSVAALLEREGIEVTKGHANEIAYSTANCSPDQLLTSPLATQCCYFSDGGGQMYTKFVNTARNPNAAVTRWRNPTLSACKAPDGVSSCVGMQCYWGPYGFASPQVSSAPSSAYRGYTYVDLNGRCQVDWYTPSAPNPLFSNITGSKVQGAGCCRDGSGPCGAGFQSCAYCCPWNDPNCISPDFFSGVGHWD